MSWGSPPAMQPWIRRRRGAVRSRPARPDTSLSTTVGGSGVRGPTPGLSLRPPVGHVDHDPAGRARAGEGEDAERQPGAGADAEGRVTLERAAVDHVSEGPVPGHMGDVDADSGT